LTSDRTDVCPDSFINIGREDVPALPRSAVVADVTLAVNEALANAVEHSYHPHHPNPVMQLQARIVT
jgi:hypothetical protein